MFWRKFPVFLWFVCLVALADAAQARTVHIGVLAFRPKPETMKQWQPLGGVLKQAMPEHDFSIEAYTFPEMQQAVAGKRLEFILTNPGHYVLLARRLGLSAPLATLVVDYDGIPMQSFGGVIFTRSSREDLNRLEDLSGKNVAITSTESLGGYQMQAYELSQVGIRPNDLRLTQTGMPHDKVVQAVLEGKADAGFVRTGVLEAMQKEGKLDLSGLKIINEQLSQNFPQRLSTRQYPEWAFAALTGADRYVARHIAAALFLLEENREATRAMDIYGFTTSSDYAPVEEVLRELRFPPFEQAPKFTWQDVWARYSRQTLAALAALAVILLLSTRVYAANRRLKQERRKLEHETQLRHGLLNAMGEGVYGVDNSGRCVFVNPAALEMLGFTEEEILAGNKHQMFHHHYPDGSSYPESECPIYKSLHDGQPRKSEELFWRKDGSSFPVALTVSPTSGEYGLDGAVVVFHDITERKQREEWMRHLAQHDVLTGLPNRTLFNDRLQYALFCAKRDNQRFALLYIDLDRFKPVNDAFGHKVGDELLQQAAQRMRKCVRDSDTVARIGGDEFMVLLRMIDTEQDAVMVGEKIRAVLNEPFHLGEFEIDISCSIGIALYPDHASDAASLADFADAAMYSSKQQGRDQVRLYLPKQD